MRERIDKIKSRTLLFEIIIFLFLFIIGARSFQLQMLKGSYYSRLAKANATFKMDLKAPRGRIYDRKGKLLVENRASFSLAIIKAFSRSPADTLERISKIIKIPQSILLNRFYKYRDYPGKKPITIAENLSIRQVSFIEAHKEKFPGIVIQVEPVRYYIYPEAFSHILGYVGEASPFDIKKFGVDMGDMVGKKGLERAYEKFLEGIKGHRLYIRDSLGNPIRIEEEILPVEGAPLYTTVDLRLQRFIYNRLKNRKGGAIVLKPETGEILAMVSSPSFNSNLMSSRFNNEYKLEIMKDKNYPLYNRTIQGIYPIGSIFKLAIAAAALYKKVVTPGTKIFCPGFFRFGGRDFRCWQSGGHGWVDLYTAIEQSCNVYFYKMGANLGIENIVDVVSRFPFGEKTGVDLPNEKRGIMPSPEWKKSTLGVQWFPGDTISLSIGQGYLVATPLQTALFGAMIANRGWYPVPHFVRKVGNKIVNKGKRIDTGIAPEIFEEIIKGMKRVIERGTGKSAYIPGIEICGKTGTAQVVALEKTREVKPHSLFIAFTPCKNPEIVVFVIVERSGAGSEFAAPIVKDIIRFYYNEKNI